MSTPQLQSTEILSAAISVLERELLPGADRNYRRALRNTIRGLTEAQQRLFLRAAGRPGSAPLGVMFMGIELPSLRDDMVVWGVKLRQRREQATLTRTELAERAAIPESALRNIEEGRTNPTRDVVMRLQALRELGMRTAPGVDPLAAIRDARLLIDGISPCNCWFASEYDAIKLADELVAKLNGPGGHIEQTYLYIEPNGILPAWYACGSTGGEGGDMGPIHQVARVTRNTVAPLPIDVISLGPGKATQEILLTKSLREAGITDIRLFLLEISQSLLRAGYRAAADELGALHGVEIYAIQGNFHQLPRYTQILDAPRRRRLVCMFGKTFANLENEAEFLKNSLSTLLQGDLLLLEVPAALSPADQPELIEQYDLRLSEALARTLRRFEPPYREFCVDAFERHVEGVESLVLTSEVDTAICPVPGSYAVKNVATVRLARPGLANRTAKKAVDDVKNAADDAGADNNSNNDRPKHKDKQEERRFSISQEKRYQPSQLDLFMATHGWLPIRTWRYAERRQPLLYMLYRKNGC